MLLVGTVEVDVNVIAACKHRIGHALASPKNAVGSGMRLEKDFETMRREFVGDHRCGEHVPKGERPAHGHGPVDPVAAAVRLGARNHFFSERIQQSECSASNCA